PVEGAVNSSGRIVKVKDRARLPEQEHHSKQESEVANAIHDERFLGGVVCKVLCEVIPDQQIRAETDAFPAYEHQKEIVRDHQRQHRKHEQVKESKEPPVAIFASHVPGSKNVNPKRDERDKQDVDSR